MPEKEHLATLVPGAERQLIKADARRVTPWSSECDPQCLEYL
jgi:hypothetical protein